MDNQGHPADHVGVNISKNKDKHYQFSQRSLIENVVADANLSDFYTKPAWAKSTLMLHAF